MPTYSLNSFREKRSSAHKKREYRLLKLAAKGGKNTDRPRCWHAVKKQTLIFYFENLFCDGRQRDHPSNLIRAEQQWLYDQRVTPIHTFIPSPTSDKQTQVTLACSSWQADKQIRGKYGDRTDEELIKYTTALLRRRAILESHGFYYLKYSICSYTLAKPTLNFQNRELCESNNYFLCHIRVSRLEAVITIDLSGELKWRVKTLAILAYLGDFANVKYKAV